MYLSITKAIKEIFKENNKKDYSATEIGEILNSKHCIPSKKRPDGTKQGFSSHLIRLTRQGLLIRIDGENGEFRYRLRTKND